MQTTAPIAAPTMEMRVGHRDREASGTRARL
jgi:hypothetical protein